MPVYVTAVLTPHITVPVAPKPIVESTVITEEPTDTPPITLVLPGTVKLPSIASLPYPTNRFIL